MGDFGDSKRAIRRETPDRRRTELIEATLRVVAERGIESASVRAIAAEAGVTAGLIRHHFHSKDDLLQAAYDFHMERLAAFSEVAVEGTTAATRLASFVRQTLSPPVAEPRALQLWAGFLQMVPHSAQMRDIHRRHYERFRQRLEPMIADALAEAGRACQPRESRALAISCNALLDGLWLEGSALPDLFGTEELVDLGLTATAALLNVDSLPRKVVE